MIDAADVLELLEERKQVDIATLDEAEAIEQVIRSSGQRVRADRLASLIRTHRTAAGASDEALEWAVATPSEPVDEYPDLPSWEPEEPSPIVAPPDWVFPEDFTGTDDERVQKAAAECKRTGKGLAFHQRATPYDLRRPIVAFDGLAIAASDPGPKLQMKPPNPLQLDLNYTGALVQAQGTVYGIYLGNLPIFGNNTARVWQQVSGSVYGAQFHALGLYGTGGGFGGDTEKCAVTQGFFTGHWQVHGYRQTPFHLAGADCRFRWLLNIDSPTDVAGNGRPQVWFDGMEKVLGCDGIYSTGRNGWIPLRVSGGDDRQLVPISRSVFEGYKANSPTAHAAIQIQGGVVELDKVNIGYVGGTAKGMIEKSGGHLRVGSVGVKQADGKTLPLLYETGGTHEVIGTPVGYGGGSRQPVTVRKANGQTVTYSIS